jgi:chromosome segregation ATPase
LEPEPKATPIWPKELCDAGRCAEVAPKQKTNLRDKTMRNLMMGILVVLAAILGFYAYQSSQKGNALETDLAARTATVKKLEDEKTKLAEEVTTLTDQLNAATKISINTEAEREAEMAALLETAEAAEAKAASLISQISTVEADKATLAAQIASLEAEKAATMQNSEAALAETAALISQISTVEAEKAALAGQIASLEAEKTALAGQIASLEAEKTALADKAAELQNLVDELTLVAPPGTTTP